MSRPYFEVLIVDEMSPSEEDALRRRVQRKRSPDDDFVFDVLMRAELRRRADRRRSSTSTCRRW